MLLDDVLQHEFDELRGTLESYHRELENLMSTRWMDHRPIEAMIHVLEDVPDDLARLTQRLLVMESAPPDPLLEGIQNALGCGREMFFYARRFQSFIEKGLDDKTGPILSDFLALHALLQSVRLALVRGGVRLETPSVNFERLSERT